MGRRRRRSFLGYQLSILSRPSADRNSVSPQMRLSELDYDLPEELIAQEPLARRDDARLLVLNRRRGTFEHSRFYKIGHYLREGDLLVLNNTRVFPARILARKESGGAVELLFVRPADNLPGAWIALARTHRGLREGTRLKLEDGRGLRVAGYFKPGRPLIASDDAPIAELLEAHGAPALPHYIRRPVSRDDLADYQTIYAGPPGAVAAPTAGLHFTSEL